MGLESPPLVPALRKLCAITSLATVCACSGGDGPPPDVLLISLDTVRADYLTFLDGETAPNMARLARRGTVFTQALSGSSWTLPAHAQMFTGNPPSVNGVQIDTVRIDPRHPTLPELLRKGGYRTAGFWTGWYLAGEYGFARGFDVYESAMTVDPESNVELRRALEERGDAEGEIRSLLREVSNHEDVTSKEVAARVRGAIEGAGAGERLFLFAHFFDPHYDYVPPPPFDTQFDPDYAGTLDGRGFFENKRIYDRAKKPPRQISERDLEHVRALYRGEIAWVDRAVGEIVDALEASGRLAHTLIVITSDHGEEFFEHGNRGHRNHLHDEVLRVPLLVVPPRSRERARPDTCDTQVTLSDLLPTLLDYAGEETPAGVYGRSLRPLVEGRSLPERAAVSSLLLRVAQPDTEGFQYWLTQAARTPGSKFVRTLELVGGRPKLRAIVHYDLTTDPGERRPNLKLPQDEVERLWEAFEDDLDALRVAFDSVRHSPSEERGTRAREGFEGELAELGYADAGTEGADDAAPEPWVWSPTPRLDFPRGR